MCGVATMSDITKLASCVISLFSNPLLSIQPSNYGMPRASRIFFLVLADCLKQLPFAGNIRECIFSNILRTVKVPPRFHLALEETMRCRNIFAFPTNTFSIANKELIAVEQVTQWRKDFVAVGKEIVGRKSRVLMSFLLEAEDHIRSQGLPGGGGGGALQACGTLLLDAWIYSIWSGLHRSKCLKDKVTYNFRGLFGGGRQFALDERLPKLLTSKKIVYTQELTQIHTVYLASIFPSDIQNKPKAEQSKSIHHTLFRFLLINNFNAKDLMQQLLKALIQNKVEFLPIGNDKRLFDSRKRKGCKLMKIEAVVAGAGEDVDGADGADGAGNGNGNGAAQQQSQRQRQRQRQLQSFVASTSAHLALDSCFVEEFDTELGSAHPRFPEFSSADITRIDVLKGGSESGIKHVSKCPLLSVMLLDWEEFRTRAKKPMKPSRFRAAGFTKQDATGKLYLSRTDSGLHTSLQTLESYPQYDIVRRNPHMRRIIHKAKIAAHQVEADKIPNFYINYWSNLKLDVTGTKADEKHPIDTHLLFMFVCSRKWRTCLRRNR